MMQAVVGTQQQPQHDSKQFSDNFHQQSLFSKVAMFESRTLETQGDKLYTTGHFDLAEEKYQQSYDIESSVLGASHPKVSSLGQKIMISRAA